VQSIKQPCHRSTVPATTTRRGDLLLGQFVSDLLDRQVAQLESKDDMRRRGQPSPDMGDAMALCFSGLGGSPRGGGDPNFNRTLSYPNIRRA